MSANNIEKSTIKLVRRAYRHLTVRRRRQLIGLSVIMLLSSFVEAISIGSILPFLGALTSPEQTHIFANKLPFLSSLNQEGKSELRQIYTLIFISMVLISGLFRVVYFKLQTRISMAISIDFSVQAYERTLYQPYKEIIQKNSSEILAGAHKARELVGYLIQPVLTMVSSVLVLCAVLMTVIAVQPTVAISGIVGFGGLYLFATTISNRLLQRNSITYAKELGQVNKVIQEGVGGIRDVIIDGTQPTFTRLYRSALSKMQAAAASNVIISQMPRYFIEMFGLILLAGISYLMINRNENFVSAIPTLGVIALAAQRLLPLIQQTYAAYATIRGAYHSASDALDLLDQPILQTQRLVDPWGMSFKSLLKVEKLTFGYAPDKKIILKEVNLEIRPGEKVGIIGVTGSGKSTLVDLLMGLLLPTSGTIYIDGEKLSEANIRNWQRFISHVPQSIFLADSTIAQNIALGVENNDIDMNRVEEAARIAQISKDIESFPDGYQTRVGERGLLLSGGQKQRIGLARAIYKRSQVIVLDEATSALDLKTETEVMDAIDRIGDDATLLIIAHRIGTLQKCDKLIQLTDGVISWSGNYDELITKSNIK